MATTFLDAGTSATYGTEFWQGGQSGTITSDATVVHTGPRSLKMFNGAYIYTANGVTENAGGRISMYVYFPSVTPAAIGGVINTETSGGGLDNIVCKLNTSGNLGIWLKGATPVTVFGSTVLLANTWYRISMAWTWTSTTVNESRLWINGVLEVTRSNVTTGAFAQSVILVSADGAFGANWVTYYSDEYADNSTALTDPGDIRVTAKRPNANGTTNGWIVQIGSGGSGYGTGHSPQVNEQALSVTNGWQTALLSTTEEYSIEGLSVGDIDLTGATIVDFVGWVYANASGSVTAQIVVAGSSSNISLTTTNTMFTKVAGSTTYPAGNTDIGMISSGSAGTDSLYECGVLIAYLVPAAVTVVLVPVFEIL